MRTLDLWESPAQYAVMQVLCWKDHDKQGFAAPSAGEIGRLIGLSKQRVRAVFAELEGMKAMTRIGVDRTDSARNRFVLSIEAAIRERKMLGGVIAGEQGGDRRQVGGVIAGKQGGDRGQVGGCLPASRTSPADLKTVKEERLENAKEAVAARRLLPLFPLPPQPKPHERDVAAANKIRLERLRRRVAGLARELLLNPVFGRELLHGEDADASIGALYSAVKLLCARKRIPGYGDVAHAMCVSEFFKFKNRDVINGTAPRPRDRARERRERGRR